MHTFLLQLVETNERTGGRVTEAQSSIVVAPFGVSKAISTVRLADGGSQLDHVIQADENIEAILIIPESDGDKPVFDLSQLLGNQFISAQRCSSYILIGMTGLDSDLMIDNIDWGGANSSITIMVVKK